MKILKQAIDHKEDAFVALMPEEPEDMWHCYNLIQVDDTVRAGALRKVIKENSDTGDKTSKRIHMMLTINVTGIDFDPGAAQLHIAGYVIEENPHVTLGSHHTLDLELHRQFTLTKHDGWDSIARTILRESSDSSKRAVLWAVVMQEGLAHICHITEHQTILKQTIETSIPRKRMGGAADNEKGMLRFYETLLSTLLRHVDLKAEGTPLLLASPGFVAGSFQAYMKKEAIRTGNKPLQVLQASVIVTYASSGHIHALNEVLASPAVKTKLADTKFARETGLMDKFFEMLRLDDGRAWYGPKEIEKAVEKGAVGRGGGILLINDTLFRANNVAERRRWVSLCDQVAKVEGGEVRKLSSMHESGKRLESLGNIAAILTYPIEDLDEDEEEGEDEVMDGAVDTQQL